MNEKIEKSEQFVKGDESRIVVIFNSNNGYIQSNVQDIPEIKEDVLHAMNELHSHLKQIQASLSVTALGLATHGVGASLHVADAIEEIEKARKLLNMSVSSSVDLIHHVQGVDTLLNNAKKLLGKMGYEFYFNYPTAIKRIQEGFIEVKVETLLSVDEDIAEEFVKNLINEVEALRR